MSLELFGQRLTVVSDNDPDRVRELLSFVSRRLEEIRDTSKKVQTDQIALLAALNIADELFRERERNLELRQKVRDRSLKLLGAIDGIARDFEPTAFAFSSIEQVRPAPAGAIDAVEPIHAIESPSEGSTLFPLPGA